MKVCTRCKIEKEYTSFTKNKAIKDGYSIYCKPCKSSIKKQSYGKHKKSILVKNKKWAKNNPEKSKQIKSRWLENNVEKRKEILKKYKKSDKYKNWVSYNLNYKISARLRSRISIAIKNNWKTGSAVTDLGCSIEELKIHLESKFQSGMTWENYGRWHIDHIKPLSSFDLTKREEFLEACNYNNLQPLWAEDNLKKGNKIEENSNG